MTSNRRLAPLAALAALLLAAPLDAQGSGTPATSDRELVRRAVLDYVEGIYEVTPARIERSVSPTLAKFGYHVPPGDTTTRPRRIPMTFAQLVNLAATYNRDGRVPAGAPKRVDLFEVQDRTASVKLTAHWGTDYMLLAKEDGRWQITHVLWQGPLGAASAAAR